MTLANRITVLRLLLVPFFLFLLKYPNIKYLTAFLYFTVCCTDALDGYIARKWDQITDLGKFLDPLADKLIVDLPLIYFVASGAVSPWVVILVIGREFFVTGLRLLAAGKGLVIAAGWWGKVKTVLQMGAVILLILEAPMARELLWISVAAALWSGWVIWKQSKVVFSQS
ncbi:MAG: CDP-diacylglycerol--glycerol-3-phosphate 3-phosphatidyltransferase [Candidatus Margulisiibacteriota bacterium]